MNGQHVPPMAAEPPEPRLFVVYWREGRCRRQLFAFRAQVRAASAAEARRGFHLPRGPQPHVFGVKLLRDPGGGCALSGRWVG